MSEIHIVISQQICEQTPLKNYVWKLVADDRVEE